MIVSPKTGKLIKTTGKAYSDLLKDEKYRDFLLNPSTHENVKARVETSGLPPLRNVANLSPLQKKSPPSTKLPPLPMSPRRKLSELPPLPSSPAHLPASPRMKMADLPPLPILSLSPNIPPSLKIAGKVERVAKLPTLSPKLPPLSPKLPPLSPKLPALSPKLSPVSKKDELEEILSMPFADIPTLEETLKKTKQPAKRAKLERMIKEKKYLEGRGIKTRGWDARAPTRGRERHQLHRECGDKCFLLPESEKFPICASPRMTGGKSKCEIDCGAVLSAKVRANQWGYKNVAKNADVILKECEKDGLEHFVPKKTLKELPPLSPRLSPSAMMAGKMDQDDCGCGN